MTATTTHYTITRSDVSDDSWGEQIILDAPTVGETERNYLRNRVCDRRWQGGDAIQWYAGDSNAWAAVTDLHRHGQHDQARTLAELLFWTEQRATARDLVVWTLVVA